MIGWVSFTLMAMYSSIGEGEDGTLIPRTLLEDALAATELTVEHS